MKKAKRIVALALSAVMAAGLLAGCGGTAPSSISASGTGADASEQQGNELEMCIRDSLNEIRHPRVKKFFQTVFTFPHFISWVVLSGILINMFASNGIINQVLGQLGFDPVAPLMSLTAFRPFIWISNIWKEFGWDAIIYICLLYTSRCV